MSEAVRLGRVLLELGLREFAKAIDEGAARLRQMAEDRSQSVLEQETLEPETTEHDLVAELERVEPEVAATARLVRIDVGPLENFGQLAGLQDAAAEIDGATAVGIERFSNRRARLVVELTDPVDLLRELEERADLEFTVRARDGDEIVLDVSE